MKYQIDDRVFFVVGFAIIYDRVSLIIVDNEGVFYKNETVANSFKESDVYPTFEEAVASMKNKAYMTTSF